MHITQTIWHDARRPGADYESQMGCALSRRLVHIAAPLSHRYASTPETGTIFI